MEQVLRVLACMSPARQDVAVSDPSEDLASRGQAIFQRLREQQDGTASGSDVVDDPTPSIAPELDPADDGDQAAGDAPSDGSPTRSESVVAPEAGAEPDGAARSGPAEEPKPGPRVEPDLAPQRDAAADRAPHPALELAELKGPLPPGASAEPQSDVAVDGSTPTAAEAGDARLPSPATPAPAGRVEPVEMVLTDEELTSFTTAPPAKVTAPPAGPLRGPLPGAEDLLDLEGARAPESDAGLAAPPVDVVAAAPVLAPSAFARDLPRIMAVANQKGGVGKTTTAVNLGACLADLGYRVLVVDLDPQGNASTGLGINIRDLQGSMYDVVLHDLPIEDCVEATSVRNLFCAPSSLDLAGAEIELVPAFSRELRLKRALEEVRDDYDFVLIDCPPSLGLLTVNGLAAATEVVVPIQCEYYALEGLGQLLRNVNLVQKNLNPQLEVTAIILVMYDARTKLADQVVNEVREHFGAKVCRNVVPRTVRLSEAPSFGQPIIAFDPTSRGAIAYRELAKEVSGGTPQRAR